MEMDKVSSPKVEQEKEEEEEKKEITISIENAD